MDRGIKPVDYYRDENGVHPIWGIDWHYVGASGEPAFQNSWTNVGDPYQVARFGKEPSGKLQIEGRITGGALNTVAWTNPVGFRPPKKMVFYVVLAASGHVEVDTNGDVKIVS